MLQYFWQSRIINHSSYNVGSDQEMNFMELLFVYVTNCLKPAPEN